MLGLAAFLMMVSYLSVMPLFRFTMAPLPPRPTTLMLISPCRRDRHMGTCHLEHTTPRPTYTLTTHDKPLTPGRLPLLLAFHLFRPIRQINLLRPDQGERGEVR